MSAHHVVRFIALKDFGAQSGLRAQQKEARDAAQPDDAHCLVSHRLDHTEAITMSQQTAGPTGRTLGTLGKHYRFSLLCQIPRRSQSTF